MNGPQIVRTVPAVSEPSRFRYILREYFLIQSIIGFIAATAASRRPRQHRGISHVRRQRNNRNESAAGAIARSGANRGRDRMGGQHLGHPRRGHRGRLHRLQQRHRAGAEELRGGRLDLRLRARDQGVFRLRRLRQRLLAQHHRAARHPDRRRDRACAAWLGDNTECLLPTSSSDQLGYGEVKEDLYDFYAFGPRDTFYDSLADSFNQAVAQLAQVNPDKPWAIAGHSLGGALATLGAIDAVVGSTYNGPNNPNPLLVTFGSLHVGLESFKEQFKLQVPQTLRFANLCDFVPSLVSLEPFTNPKPYEHVGVECTFIWQKWDDWANHSMDLYLETIRDHMGVIKVGPRHYPE